MKRVLIIFGILILSIFLINQIPLTKATFQDNTSLQQIAYDCGGLLNTTNGVYRMNQSITAAGTCFTISAQNITLDCQGFNITYSTGGLANNYGITTTQFNTTIKNCKILDGNWTSVVTSRYGIYFNGASNGTSFNNSANTSSIVFLYQNGANYNNITLNNATSISNACFYISGSNYNNLTLNSGTTTSGQSIYIYASLNSLLTSNNGTSNSSYGIYINSALNNTLIFNKGTSTSNTGIQLSNSTYNNLTFNMGVSSSGYSISLSVSPNNTLAFNNATSPSGGILISSSNYNILTSNNGTSGPGYGLYLISAVSNTINFSTITGQTYIYNSTYNNLNSNIFQSLAMQSSANNIFTLNNINVSSTHGLVLNFASNNTFISNNGTSTFQGMGIYLSNSSNYNKFTLNRGSSNSSYGLYLESSSNNNFTNDTEISNLSYGIYLYNSTYNKFISSNATSNLSYGVYLLASFNNSFTNLSWTDWSRVSEKINFYTSLTSSKLDYNCIPGNVSSVAMSYKRTDENSWNNLTINRSSDIYVVGDSISAAGLWETSLDSYLGSNSINHNFGVSATICAYSYDRYVQNVTNSSNATVVVFCGVNDYALSIPFANTTYYLEAMYNLSVARGQQIVFVNVGTCTYGDLINPWLLSFTQSKGVPLVDFYSLMSIVNSSGCFPNLSVTDDFIHPKTYGYRQTGKLIWQQGFNSSVMFNLNKSLIHLDQGKTYNLRCTTADDNLFETYYTLPSSFTSGGGIIDNASTLNTTLTNVTAKINESSYNSSSVYYDSTLINITSDTSNLEFNYNFSKYDFNFTSVSIDNETVGDKKFLSVWGIAEDGVVGTKSMKIYNANPSYNSVCVKDEENVTSISAACTDTNETKVLCDSNSHNGYVCTLSGTTLTITGLKHSGVMQMYQDVSVAAAEDNSGSGPGSFNPSNQTLENGYNANVAKDDKINFKFENETKTILIEKVSADNVEFSIDSKDYSIIINQTMKIDLNSDGYYDIQIFLKSVYSGRAILELKLINEKIPAEEQASSQEQTQTGNVPEKKSNNYIWIFIAAGVLILAFAIILSKKKK